MKAGKRKERERNEKKGMGFNIQAKNILASGTPK